MKRQRQTAIACFGLILLGSVAVEAQKKSKYACDEAQPETLCTAANTCGSPTAPCTVDIRKQGSGAAVRPGLPNAKDNQFFCLKAGTSVVWMSSKKNTGFTVAFGADSPFTPDDPIMGGSSKQVTVKAETPGCYKYDVGASVSGAIYGMSGSTSKPELVILP
jgi:hypothetical protein